MIEGIEVQVISKILTCDDDQETLDTLLSFSPDLYFSAYLDEINYIHDHKEKYGVVPSQFDFLTQFSTFNIIAVPEPLEYLVRRLREYRQRIILIETFNKIKDLGDGDAKDAWKYIGMQCEKAQMLEENNPMNIVQEAEVRAEQIKEYSKQQRIPTGFPELDKLMYGGLSTIEELLVIIARTNSGKAQPLWAPVLTPNGWTTMGELKVGDEVVGINNDNGRVVQLFPQGVKDYYRVHFDDGTYAECCDDHLWVVRAYREDTKDFVIPLKMIREYSSTAFYVPLCGELNYDNVNILDDHTPENFSGFFSTDEHSKILADGVRKLGKWVKVTKSEDGFIHIDVDKARQCKRIVSIKYIGQTECQCILLDNESHTYITSDYTVTHNTWVCTKIMESAQKNGFPVAYYSPEMQAAFMGTRFDTWRGHFENNKLIRGDYSDEYNTYIDTLKEEKTPAYIIEDKDFPDGVSVRTLDPFVRKHGIKLLIIDGISYMQDDHKATRDQEKYKNIAMGLFQLSKKYGCAVVLVMQANREVKNKDDKGESIPTLYNAEGSDQPARIATQAFGIRQIFDKHVLDIGLLKSRMANNTTPVFSYAWDINTGNTQYIPGDNNDTSSASSNATVTPTLTAPSISFGQSNAPSSSETLSLIDDNDDSDIEF